MSDETEADIKKLKEQALICSEINGSFIEGINTSILFHDLVAVIEQLEKKCEAIRIHAPIRPLLTS